MYIYIYKNARSIDRLLANIESYNQWNMKNYKQTQMHNEEAEINR